MNSRQVFWSIRSIPSLSNDRHGQRLRFADGLLPRRVANRHARKLQRLGQPSIIAFLLACDRVGRNEPFDRWQEFVSAIFTHGLLVAHFMRHCRGCLEHVARCCELAELAIDEADLGGTRSAGFRWRHRFLRIVQTAQQVKPLAPTGVVEVDETLFLRYIKAQR